MLKGIDPLLNADVLHAIESMGHGDAIVVCDTNFPAQTVASQTVLGKVLHMGANSPRTVKALLSLMPLDTFIHDAACRMEVVGNPAEILPVMREVQAEIDLAEGKPWPLVAIERFAFYERAKRCFTVVQAHERRFYGCFVLTKGVIPPDV